MMSPPVLGEWFCCQCNWKNEGLKKCAKCGHMICHRCTEDDDG
jgi:hypothetical protein